jgi:Galactose-3-O-sulfotransferase
MRGSKERDARLGDEVEPQRFFFVHLQKTAGTALFRRLRHHFGTDAVYPMPRYQGSPESVLDVGLLAKRFAQHHADIRVVTGHFPLCAVERLGVPFATFTVLREPVERALSFLRHQRQEEPRFQGTTLEQIYADPVCRDGLIRNHMVRMLSLSLDEMTDGALTQINVDEERLAVACDALEHRIDVVGIQERFEEFCDALARRFGWDLGPSQFANRTPPMEASAELRERIAADNDLDGRLYRFARVLVGPTSPLAPA